MEQDVNPLLFVAAILYAASPFIFGYLSYRAARARGRSAWWFLGGLAFSFVGWVIVLALPPTTIACPSCGASCSLGDRQCLACKAKLPNLERSAKLGLLNDFDGHCPTCGTAYRVSDYLPSGTPLCSGCGEPLTFDSPPAAF